MKKLLAGALLTLTASTALAQGIPQTQTAPDQVIHRSTTYVYFDGSTLDATVQKPEIDVVMGKSKVRFKNMIQVRVNFHRELVDSAKGL